MYQPTLADRFRFLANHLAQSVRSERTLDVFDGYRNHDRMDAAWNRRVKHGRYADLARHLGQLGERDAIERGRLLATFQLASREAASFGTDLLGATLSDAVLTAGRIDAPLLIVMLDIVLDGRHWSNRGIIGLRLDEEACIAARALGQDHAGALADLLRDEARAAMAAQLASRALYLAESHGHVTLNEDGEIVGSEDDDVDHPHPGEIEDYWSAMHDEQSMRLGADPVEFRG